MSYDTYGRDYEKSLRREHAASEDDGLRIRMKSTGEFVTKSKAAALRDIAAGKAELAE